MRRFALLVACIMSAHAVAADAQTDVTSVAVSALVNREPLQAHAWVGDAAVDIIAGALANQPGVVVLERQADSVLSLEARLAAFTADGGPAPAEGGTAATYVIGGWFAVADETLSAEIHLVREGATEATWVAGSEGPVAEYATVLRDLGLGVVAALHGGGGGGGLDPATAPPVAAAASYYRGRHLLRDGEYERAVADLLQAAAQAPDTAGVWTALGQALYAAGRPAAAAAALERVLTLSPDGADTAESLLHLARAQALAGDVDGAIASYIRLIDQHPYSSLVEATAGNGWRRRSFADIARADLTQLAVTEARYETLMDLAEDGADRRRWIHRYRYTNGAWPQGVGHGHRLAEGGPTEIALRSGYIDVPLIAPEGKAIEAIELELTAQVRRANLNPVLFLLQGDPESTRIDGDTVNLELEIPLAGEGPWTASAELPTTGWNGANLRLEFRNENGSSVASLLRVTPRLRAMRPGSLELAVEPTDAVISLQVGDEAPPILVRPPCLVRDLPPGDCRLGIAGRPDEPVFGGDSTITIGAGRTEARWLMTYTGKAPPPDAWSPARTVAPKRIEALGNEVREIACGHLPGAGWFAVWDQAGDLHLAVAQEAGGRWRSGPLPAPINTTGPETILGAAVMPTGRAVLCWRRGKALWASASDDLRFWSQPERIYEPRHPLEFNGLLQLAPGRGGELELFAYRGTQVLRLTTEDGLHWTRPEAIGLVTLDGITREMLSRGAIVFEDGHERWLTHGREVKALRAHGDGSWSFEQQAIAMPPRRDPPRLWTTSAGIIAGETPHALWRRTDTGGWEPLPGTAPGSPREQRYWSLVGIAATADADPTYVAFVGTGDGQVLALGSGGGASTAQVEIIGGDEPVAEAATPATDATGTAAAEPGTATPDPGAAITDAEREQPTRTGPPPMPSSSGSGVLVFLVVVLLVLGGVGGGVFVFLRKRRGAKA